MRLCSFLAAAAVLSAGLIAHADTYNVTVSEGTTNGHGFDTVNGNPFSGPNTASATFAYTGALNFDNTAAQNGPGPGGDLNSTFGFSNMNVSGYSGSGSVSYGGQTVADYSNRNRFLNSSGSASGYTYGSYYTFDLGTLFAGTTLTVTHDDGISIFQGGSQVGTSVSGPTSVTTDTITIAQTGDTILRYARENGTPSVLQVNESSAVTPEPSSIVLLGTGLLSVAGMIRKRFAA